MAIAPMRLIAGAGSILALASLLIWGYWDRQDDRSRDQSDDRPIVAPSRVTHDGDRVVVVLDESSLAAGGIETAQPVPWKQGRRVATFGTVVEPSEIIAIIAQYNEAKARLAAAAAKATASAAAWTRAKALYSDGRSMSLAQLQAVEETFHADEAQRTEVADKVDEVAESAKQAWGDALAKSFAEQGAAAKSLRSGQLLLVRVAVPGGGTPPSWAEMSWDGGSTASAQLVTALPRVDPKFQQRVALYSIPARGGPAPGATVSVQLPSGAEREGALVPTSALVWWDGAAWVYVQVETGKFSRQRIAGPDNQADGQIFVAGLSGETPVVIEGAQILLSEESRDKIQVGEEGRSK